MESVGTKRFNKIAGRIAFYILVVIIALYTVFPFYWALVSSFKPNNELFSLPVSYLPKNFTLDNYAAVFGNSIFQQALINSSIVALTVTILSLLIGALAAYALGRFRFRGRSIVLYTILAMTIFPQIAVLGALFQIIQTFHDQLYNQLTSLILTYFLFTLPFTVWVMTGFFRSIPYEIEEAAYIDGASPLGIFWRIMLPLALPGLVTTGLMAFIGAWNEFLFALSFTNTPDKQTITLAIQTFKPTGSAGTYGVEWGQIMAASVVVTIPLIALALIFQRLILAGLTAGGVKG
ncbi:MAG TPA: carbohydrate ABC transporter permease [Chloroflexia bacterium]|nr:carbohydrate ABC transporter permease [Chloroflexia bacterium]